RTAASLRDRSISACIRRSCGPSYSRSWRAHGWPRSSFGAELGASVKVCRFSDNRVGLVEGEQVVDVSAALAALHALAGPVPPGDALVATLEAFLAAARRERARGQRHELPRLRLDSPVANPSKIVGAPVNYQKHVAESRSDRGIHHGSDVKTIDVCGL